MRTEEITLRDYQAEAVTRGTDILKKYGFVLFFMEVRTGKTITALTLSQEMDIPGKAILVVTKKKAIPFIEEDIEKVGLRGVTVINYESLHKVNPGYQAVIIDESHSIGAFPKPNQRCRRLKAICNETKYLIYLTGTPTPESWSQLYHQLWVAGSRSPWRHYYNFYRWAADHVNVVEKRIGARTIKDYSGGIEGKILPAIEPMKITVTQAEAGFKGDVDERILKVVMSEESYRIWNELKRHRLVEIGDEVVACDTPADWMNKLHQVCGGTLIMDVEEGNKEDAVLFDDSKVWAIKREFKGQKIAIIYKYRGERELLLRGIEGITEDVEEFNGDNDLWFIGQVQSIREGVSLRAADALVMYAIDYSATSYWQVRARAQYKDREVMPLYWVQAGGMLEDQVLARVRKKKNFTLRHFLRDE
jgi:hypothetical protein